MQEPTLSAGRLTDVPGIAVGHWTDPVARTGCTVTLLPEGTTASGEVRGGAPATRAFSLLEVTRTVSAVDAVLLTGGSEFGLAAAEGVMDHLAAQGRGFPTPAGRVPIVPTLALFDLAVGDASVRPDAAAGRAAAAAASTEGHDVGAVGAGIGCTIGDAGDPTRRQPGGLVAASSRLGDAVIAVLVAVNAAGSVGATSSIPSELRPDPPMGTNTTIGIVATSASLDPVGCHLLAESAHDGLARAVFPSHTRFDGDAFVAATTGAVGPGTGPGIDTLRAATITLVEQAIRTLTPQEQGEPPR